MKKENKKQQEKRYKVKKNNDSMGKYIYSTILIFLGIAEGYFIVNNPEELLWIMILGVLLAVDSCLLISSIHVKQTKSTSGMYEFIEKKERFQLRSF